MRLPKIDVTARSLHEISDDAWRALLADDCPATLFQHAGTVVEVVLSHDGYRIEHLTTAALRGRLDRSAEWKKGGGRTWPPAEVIHDMLAMPKPLPVLRRVVGVPVFLASGALVSVPGYDPASGLYYQPLDAPIPPVPTRPSLQDMERAKALLLGEWLADFPFVDDAARAHALAAPITGVLREMIDGPTPLFGVDAPAPGTGKGLFAQTAGLVLDGALPAVMTEARAEEEQRKQITALLRDGVSVVLLDNVKRRLESAALAAVLTSTAWKDRILGKSETALIPNRALWLATGNNLQLNVEIARRTVWIRLDLRVDRPWQREGFKHDPLTAWVRENRHELVWGLLVLCAHWLACGRPAWSGRPLGSFEQWSRTVGGVLETAGVTGFLENREELYRRADAETEEWRTFVAAWWERFGDQSVTVADLYPLVQQYELLPSVFRGTKDGATDRSLKTRLGMALRRQADRRYAEFFVRDDGQNPRTKAAMYRLELAERALGAAEPLDERGEGFAEVPQDIGSSSDSSAEPAEPRSNVQDEREIDGRTDGGEAPSINVPRVPHVPHIDSEEGDPGAEPPQNLFSRFSNVPRCPGCGGPHSVVALSSLCGRCRLWGVVPEWAELVARRTRL